MNGALVHIFLRAFVEDRGWLDQLKGLPKDERVDGFEELCRLSEQMNELCHEFRTMNVGASSQADRDRHARYLEAKRLYDEAEVRFEERRTQMARDASEKAASGNVCWVNAGPNRCPFGERILLALAVYYPFWVFPRFCERKLEALGARIAPGAGWLLKRLAICALVIGTGWLSHYAANWTWDAGVATTQYMAAVPKRIDRWVERKAEIQYFKESAEMRAAEREAQEERERIRAAALNEAWRKAHPQEAALEEAARIEEERRAQEAAAADKAYESKRFWRGAREITLALLTLAGYGVLALACFGIFCVFIAYLPEIYGFGQDLVLTIFILGLLRFEKTRMGSALFKWTDRRYEAVLVHHKQRIERWAAFCASVREIASFFGGWLNDRYHLHICTKMEPDGVLPTKYWRYLDK